MRTPREQREIIPGAAYSTTKLVAIIGPEGYDRLVDHGLLPRSLNGRDYWFLSEDVIEAMKKCPSVKPSKRGRNRYQVIP